MPGRTVFDGSGFSNTAVALVVSLMVDLTWWLNLNLLLRMIPRYLILVFGLMTALEMRI